MKKTQKIRTNLERGYLAGEFRRGAGTVIEIRDLNGNIIGTLKGRKLYRLVEAITRRTNAIA